MNKQQPPKDKPAVQKKPRTPKPVTAPEKAAPARLEEVLVTDTRKPRSVTTLPGGTVREDY